MLTQSGAPGCVDPVVSLAVESTIKLCLVMKCFPSVFWCHFEYKIILYYHVIITSK